MLNELFSHCCAFDLVRRCHCLSDIEKTGCREEEKNEENTMDEKDVRNIYLHVVVQRNYTFYEKVQLCVPKNLFRNKGRD